MAFCANQSMRRPAAAGSPTTGGDAGRAGDDRSGWASPLGVLALSAVLCADVLARADDGFQLTGPLISKIDWNTRGLCAGDIDGDGRLDLALVNNDLAQVDMLYQRTPEEMTAAAKVKLSSPRWEPIIEDAPFLKESVTTGDFMYDLEILDVDGDGRSDLVYTGKRNRLAVRLQTGDGVFDDEWSYDRDVPSANVGSLAVADVDRDGRDDLVVLTTTSILVFHLDGELEAFPGPDKYRVSEENPQRLGVRDINGDGRPDLAYMAESSDRALRVRYQDVHGGFGPELGVPVPVGAEAWDVLPVSDERAELVTIKRTRAELQFTPLSGEPGGRAHRTSLAIRNYPVPKSGVDPALYAVADFDGDERVDVAVADTNGAAIHVYLQDDSGEFRRPTEFPSLQGISSISVLHFADEERAALLVCSEKEGMVGISRVNAGGRLGFPVNIAMTGEPLVGVGADLDGDGTSEVIVAAKDGRRFNLEVLRLTDGAWAGAAPVKLGAIKRSPTHLHATDLDGDGGTDLVMFIPREATRMFVKQDGDAFEEIAEEDSVRTSQFEGVMPDRFSTGDFTGDGQAEMLVAGKGFVRAYRVQPDGSLQIVDQANARSSLDELTGPMLFDIDADGTPELLSYFEEEAQLQVLSRDDTGLYSYRESIDLAAIGLTRVAVEDLGGAAGERLLFFGKDRFWSIPPRQVSGSDEAPRSFRTDLEDVKYSDFALGDLNADGYAEIIGLDSSEHVLEILSGGRGEPWQSRLFFTIFEKNRFNRSNKGGPIQPREMLVGDFNADLRTDLVLLCHDRVLLYPQAMSTETD